MNLLDEKEDSEIYFAHVLNDYTFYHKLEVVFFPVNNPCYGYKILEDKEK